MTEKSKTKSRVYLAGKESTVKAVELLQSRLNNRKRSWDNKDNDKSHKMTHRCTSMPLQKKSDYVSLTGFSKSLLMLERHKDHRQLVTPRSVKSHNYNKCEYL
uniref:uncharacterized protein LOC127070925 isoform X3 n=1 Tax=Vespula vulgaris TaxID=7454 RepID=UPI00223C4598|nr:uncharacterized protein LOC127070925 isoform X3 [Vespula vulgaris]